MPIVFEATEAGFLDGLGGASNAVESSDYHYVLFGKQVDEQDPSNTGVYFEYDDQVNGSVNTVEKVLIAENEVTFFLDGESIVVRSTRHGENGTSL